MCELCIFGILLSTIQENQVNNATNDVRNISDRGLSLRLTILYIYKSIKNSQF